MLFNRYLDLNDLFINLNKAIATDPDKMAISKSTVITQVKPLVLEALSYNFDINISKLQYGTKKFKKLKELYVDQEELKWFKEKIQNQKGLSCTFYFKQRKPQCGTNSDNGPCLISIVLTRNNRSSKFTRADVFYRASQLNRIFSVDLLLLNKFMSELPDCCDIKTVCIVIPQPFQVTRYLPAQEELFGFTIEDIKGKENKERYQKILDTTYNGQHSSYKSVKRMQMVYYKEKEWPYVDQEKLKLED